MDAAVEPTQQERDLYYHGIPSRPKLVARSSPEPWVLVQSEWSGPRRKAMYAVGDHPIVAIWNDDASTSGTQTRTLFSPSRAVTSALVLRKQLKSFPALEKFMELEQQLALCRDDDRIMRKFQFQKSMLNDIEPVITEYRDQTQPDARVIGKVEYAREYGIHSHGELSDWCLIQLDPGRYEKALSRLENRVFIGTGFHLVNEAFREAGPDEDGTLKKLWHVMVGKRGSGSGLTFGSYNQVKSVVRHIYNADCPPFTAVEWCIIADPDKPDAAFSKGGDSGACVWTL